jgi:hypothetical protein
MQAIGIILFLISVGTVVGPVAAVVITYRDNPIQMVIPPQLTNAINQIVDSQNGGGNNIGNSNNNETNPNDGQNGGNGVDNGNDGNGGFMSPVFVGAQIDNVSRTFSVTVNFTDTFGFDLTLNAVSGDVVCSQHSFQLGSISLANPVDIVSGETAQITVSGSWTQEAETHVQTDHGGASSVDASIVNLSIDVNGLVIQEPGPISVGSIPIA